jgi:branched-chain amino acid transport system substrate-binding protein
VDVLMMREALVRADKAGKLNGPGVKEAFETLREWTPGLGRPPVTITPTDHRPGSLVRIYMIKDKKFNLVKEVDLKRRWPDKWEKEWLGW